MSQKLTSEEQDKELSWEEAVSRYLEDNPDYFLRHPESLARLTLAHDVDGRAVSLIERQVQVLREQNLTLQRQLRELVSIARENDVLGSRLHRFALAMIDSGSMDDVFDSAYELLRQEFKLDSVTILLKGDPEAACDRREFVGSRDKKLNSVLKQFSGGKPVCGGKYDGSLMRYLFGEQAAEIRSSALIPLALKTPQGVLCLGSRDPHRFHPGMGTVYLTKLGEMLMTSIARYHI